MKVIAGLVFVSLALAACSSSGTDSASPAASNAPSMEASMEAASPAAGAQTVKVAMTEFAFSPSDISVEAGTPVRFVITNEGQAEHEAVVGDMAFQDEHEAEMAEGGSMAMDSDEPEVALTPGETGTIDYTFEKPGTYFIGCHIAGHWTAGMKATITAT